MMHSIRIRSFTLLVVAMLYGTARASPTNDSPSVPLTPTVAGAGWSTVTFPELVKSSHANCVIKSSTLISCASAFQVNGLTNTAVHGNGVEIQFTNPEGGQGGVLFTNATNVVFSNFTISWLSGGARDPIVPGGQRIQSLGKIVACPIGMTGGMISLDLPLEGTQGLGDISVWDTKAGWPWYPSAKNVYAIGFAAKTTTNFSEGRTTCIPQLSQLVGQRVLLRHIICTNHAFHCVGCHHVTVKNVHVTSAPGMGFVFEGGGSDISLISNVVAPRCSPNCSQAEPSTTADASHFADIAGDLLIEDNDFGWQGDDDLNVTGLLAPAQRMVGASLTGSWVSVDAEWSNRLDTMNVGDELSIYDLGLNALGVVTILAVNPATGAIQLSSLPKYLSNFVISRTAGIPKNVVIRSNHFHDNRARGILMGGSYSLIENNVIERTTMEAILLDADANYWYEGPGAQHVRIQSNTISEVNRFPDMTTYPDAISAAVSFVPGFAGPVGSPIQDIVIVNNSITQVFTNSAQPVSIGVGVTGVQVSGN